jgi:hypothetical protein
MSPRWRRCPRACRRWWCAAPPIRSTRRRCCYLELETITAVHWINEKRIGITVKNLRVEFDGNLDELAVDVDGSNITRLISGNWEHRSNPTGSWSATRC